MHSRWSRVVTGGGPALFGAQDEASERETAIKLAAFAELVVQGSIDDVGDRWRIVLSVRETSTGQSVAREELETDKNGLEAGVLDLEARVLGHLDTTQMQPHDRIYVRPRLEQMQPYLNALAQSLMLGLVANEILPKQAMWGERNMLEWPLTMTLRWPDLETANAMYLSGISHAARYRSDVLGEFEERSFALLREMRAVKRERSERRVSWVVKLLVAGTARSVPAMVGSEQLASFAMVESGLLVMAMVEVPRAVASRRASVVSAVSADWEMTMKQGFLSVWVER